MSVLTRPRAEPSANGMEMPWRPPYRFTVRQYHRLVEENILKEDDRVELLEGWIIPKMTHRPLHDATIDLTENAVRDRLPKGWRVRVQSAITTADSEPEPDIAMVRGEARDYVEAHPRPKDIGMLIEVSETTLQQDRGPKERLYARARIPVYWIINLVEAKVEVYMQPKGGKSPSYQQRVDYGIDEEVPLVLDGREIARIPVRELLP